MPDKESIYGKTLFCSNVKIGEAIYGKTYFYALDAIPNKQAIYGSTTFLESYEFPPPFLNLLFFYSVFDIPLFETTIIKLGVGEQRITNAPGVKYKYRVHFEYLSQTQIDAVIDFFTARRGKAQAFTLVHPLRGYRIVRFDRDISEVEYVFYQLYNFNEIEMSDIDETIEQGL